MQIPNIPYCKSHVHFSLLLSLEIIHYFPKLFRMFLNKPFFKSVSSLISTPDLAFVGFPRLHIKCAIFGGKVNQELNLFLLVERQIQQLTLKLVLYDFIKILYVGLIRWEIKYCIILLSVIEELRQNVFHFVTVYTAHKYPCYVKDMINRYFSCQNIFVIR